MIRLSHAAFAAALLAAGPVLAASDGTLGATSTGSSNISLTVAAAVKISGVNDITLNASGVGGGPTLEGSDAVCIYSSVGSNHSYKITATSNSTSFKVMDSANTSSIPYTVGFVPGINPTAWDTLTYGTPTNSFSGSGSQNCGGANNATFRVTFSSSDLAAASSGTYTSVLNLLVEPGA